MEDLTEEEDDETIAHKVEYLRFILIFKLKINYLSH